ncbi:MAG: DUF4304 domain-containing protein [Myxococcaceae bacterium]
MLTPEGFKRDKRVLRRVLPDVPSVQAINLQGSSGNLGSSGKFCVEIGVYFPAIAQLTASLRWHAMPALEKAAAYDGHIRLRVNHLLPEQRESWWLPYMDRRRDLWFDVSSEHDLGDLREVLARMLREYVVPWLRLRATPEAMIIDKAGDLPERVAALISLGNADAARVLYAAEKKDIKHDAEAIERWFEGVCGSQ